MIDTKLEKLTDHWKQAVSCFPNVYSTDPIPVSLKKWLENCISPRGENALNCKTACEQVRSTRNKELKKTMPAISPGAVMSTRDKSIPIEQRIIQLTGWMQFDIDLKDNPHLTDASHLRDEVRKIVYVAFCSISVSGKGVWGLIRIKDTAKYAAYFEQLKIDFASRGIKLDASKGGNPTDLRIYSYDPDAYVADNFLVYDRFCKQEPLNIIKHTAAKRKGKIKEPIDTRTKVEELVHQIRTQRIDIAPDYESYRNVGFAFAGEFGENGRSLFHDVCSISPKYHQGDADRQYTSCQKGASGNERITIATFFYLCTQAGL